MSGQTTVKRSVAKRPALTRVRTSAPRAKTGCSTCRVRHVKCDETRPSCRRCERTGRKCDGYTVATPSVEKQAVSASAALQIRAYAIPFAVPGGPYNRRVLHYYCVQGSEDLSNYSASDFWSRTLLQYSYDQPVVQQCLVALSAAHLEYTMRHDTGDNGKAWETPTVLQQYVKALRMLRRYTATEHPMRVLVLVCCLLLYNYEAIRGNSRAALVHLKNGTEILEEERVRRIAPHCDSPKLTYSSYGKHDRQGEDLKELTKIYWRLELETMAFQRKNIPLPLKTVPSEHIECGIDFENFQTLEDARQHLDNLILEMIRLINNNADHKTKPAEQIPIFVTKRKRELLEQFDRWGKAFSNILQREYGHRSLLEDGMPMIKGAGVLRYQQMAHQMALLATFPEDDKAYRGSDNPIVEEIIAQASKMIEPSSDCEKARTYSSETSVAGPLFNLAMLTRDPLVRKRAFTLLKEMVHRREGLFDTQMAVYVIDAMIDRRCHAEEFRTNAEISAFVRDVQTEYYKSKSIDHPLKDGEWTSGYMSSKPWTKGRKCVA